MTFHGVSISTVTCAISIHANSILTGVYANSILAKSISAATN